MLCRIKQVIIHVFDIPAGVEYAEAEEMDPRATSTTETNFIMMYVIIIIIRYV
jgi:hypothetical protein